MNPEYRPIEGPFTCIGAYNSWIVRDGKGSQVEHFCCRAAKKMAKARCEELNNPKPVDPNAPRYTLVDGEWVRKS
jgi:hypothetical protein